MGGLWLHYVEIPLMTNILSSQKTCFVVKFDVSLSLSMVKFDL